MSNRGIKRVQKVKVVPCSKKKNAIAKTVLDFRLHLGRLGYGESSVRMLPSCVGSFLLYTGKSIIEVVSSDIHSFYSYLEERPNFRRSGGLSESYIAHHMYALKLFFGWQELSGKLSLNPISGLSFRRPSSPSRTILSLSEIKSLYAVCETYQERGVLSLFYGCGLRRSEGEKLLISDVSFRRKLLYVRLGKGGKRRVVPLSGNVCLDLENYVLYERKSSETTFSFMVNRLGNGMSGSSYNQVLKDLLERSGLSPSISLHSLRHSIATHLLHNGLSMAYVRDFLGHKHLESTQVYTRVNQEQLSDL